MNSETGVSFDHRLLTAQRAVRCAARKLQRLDYTEDEALNLLRDAYEANKLAECPRSKASQSGREERLRRAQDAILQVMKWGLNESQIAQEAHVTPGAIAHILNPSDGRSVSEELTLVLEALVPKVKVMATCNASGTEANDEVNAELRAAVGIALTGGVEKVRFPKGVAAFLAAIGNPRRPVYVMLIEKPSSECVSHLKLLEHEVQHILDHIRELRGNAESKERVRREGPPEGKIA